MNYQIVKCFFNQFSMRQYLYKLLSVFGGLWLIVEILEFFFHKSCQGYGLLFILFGTLITFFISLPKLFVRQRVYGTETDIEIRIADMFDVKNVSYIMGTTQTFDTSIIETVSPSSTQGQYTQKFFTAVHELDKQIKSSLINEQCIELVKKTVGKKFCYPFGTVAKVKGDKISTTAYLSAFLSLDNNGKTPHAELIDFEDSLSKLWAFIKKDGHGGTDTLCCGILGSDFARLSLNRKQLMTKIIKSFIKETKTSQFCTKLIIAIYPPDILNKKVTFSDLDCILKYLCGNFE